MTAYSSGLASLALTVMCLLSVHLSLPFRMLTKSLPYFALVQVPKRLRMPCYPQVVHDVFQVLPDFQQESLDQMSFGAFLMMSPLQLQHSLLQGVVERYHTTMWTFITRVGEFVPSLEDMVCLTGLRVHGLSLTEVTKLVLDRAEVLQLLGPLHRPAGAWMLQAGRLAARFEGELAEKPRKHSD